MCENFNVLGQIVFEIWLFENWGKYAKSQYTKFCISASNWPILMILVSKEAERTHKLKLFNDFSSYKQLVKSYSRKKFLALAKREKAKAQKIIFFEGLDIKNIILK